MVKQSLPAVSTVTKENLEEFKTMDKVVIIGYIAAEDKASNETFTALAESKRDDYLFAVTSDPTLAKTEGVKQPSIVLYKDFDEKKDVFDGKFDKEAIISWIKTASTPLVGEIGPETYAGYMSVCIHITSFFLSQKVAANICKIQYRPEFLWRLSLRKRRRSGKSLPPTSSLLRRSTGVLSTLSLLTLKRSALMPGI